MMSYLEKKLKRKTLTYRYCLRNRNTGKINAENYYTSGQFARDNDVFWGWFCDLAYIQLEKEGKESAFIAYMNGPVLGGIKLGKKKDA